MGAMLPRARASKRSKLAEVYAMFPRLAERKRQLAGTMSGGEQQMLAIGRCLMASPELIMFDEPSLGLAPAIVQEVLHTIRSLHASGLTILLVEQNVAVSLKISQHAYVLENGRVAMSGPGAQLAGTLSGGEQQMLAIGRCLMGAPELIMFDEPSLGLAPLVVQEVLHTIHLLNARGVTILLVEQNVAVSLRISSRAYVLENGRVAMSGSGAELLHDDRVRQAYLGL